MKVILSVDPIGFPLTGIGRYTYELAQGMQQVPLQQLLFMRGLRLSGQLSGLPEQAATRGLKDGAWAKRLRASRLAGAVYGRVSPWLKGQVLRGKSDYVFHGPAYYLPAFAGPSVATVHDLSVYLWPQTHPPERVRYMRKQIRKTLERADYLITDSRYTRQEVASYFSWPAERVRAIHLACGPEFHPRTTHETAPILQQWGLAPANYVFFNGTIEPRKNIELLLETYPRLPAAMQHRWPLVLCGHQGWRSEALHQRIQVAQRQGWLKYLGFVDAEVLPVLMAGARLFVYPSLYEGFGLPVLEAMASGVPVVCSNAASLPEVTGGAAALHAPEDGDALLALLLQGLDDMAWCEQMRSAGLQRAASFSWQQCVLETLTVYQAAQRDYSNTKGFP